MYVDRDWTLYSRPTWLDPELFPFESNWVDVDGHAMHYVDEGPEDAPVLLFVHPGAGWSFTYRYQISELENDFRCIAPDLPGYGLSEARDGYGFTLLEQARVLGLFVRALGLENLIVWANDGGGPTAILGLAPLAERVAGLVVGGTFGWSIRRYRRVTLPLRIATSAPARLVNRYTNFLAWTMGSKFALGTRKLSKEERRHYTLPFKEDRASRNRVLKLYRSFLDRPTQDALDLALPAFRDKKVLAEFGDGDPVFAEGWHERWAREIPDSRVDVLRGVRHFTFEGAPEETMHNFRAWWGENFLLHAPTPSVAPRAAAQ
jgi:haloalkane dehalogenase